MLLTLFICSDAAGMSEERSPNLTAVPAKRSKAAVLKVRLYLIIGLLLVAALMGVVATVAWVTQKPPDADSFITESLAKGPAEEVAKAWLEGKPIPVGRAANVPDGALSKAEGGEGAPTFAYDSLSWDSYETDALSDLTAFEIHKFIVVAPPLDPAADPAPITYTLNVTMLLTDGKPVLGAAPSLQPYIPADSAYMFDYSTLAKDVTLSNQSAQLLQQWATAFATNDSAQLGLIVADPSKGVYDGIKGFTSGQATSIYAVPAGEDNLIVRTRVSLVSANGFKTEAEYDVLITQASSGSPHVVAWGPAGSGDSAEFVPYEFNRRPL